MDLSPKNTTTDFSTLVPDLLPYLRPWERVIAVETPVLRIPEKPLSAVAAIMQLTGAARPDEIGQKGPAMAAIATEENKNIAELNLYETLFGRDSLIVSGFLLPQFPALARATIIALARLQGTQENDASEEEPGRILHEDRDAESDIGRELREKKGWEFPYFGSVDATPLFVNLILAYVKSDGAALLDESFTAKDGKTRTVRQALDAAVGWILMRTKQNKEGFLEFCRKNPNGIPNQVWKDSWDSYFHKDGTIANQEKGIASIEVQGYAYDALMGVAELYRTLQNVSTEHIDLIEKRAQLLAHSVFSLLYVTDAQGSFFALGTDRGEDDEPRPLMIRTSNMGHLLSSRLLDGNEPSIVEMRTAVVRTVMSETMLAASGVRTLATTEVRFRPGAYHNGSVWLWDSYFIARGLRKHGYVAEADDLVGRMLRTVTATHKFPEFARGGNGALPELNTRIVDLWDEHMHQTNRIEQPPQEIQAWTVAAVLAAEYEKTHTETKAETVT